MNPKLYMVPHSPAVRAVLMAAKMLKVDMEHMMVDMQNKEHLSPKFLKMNPQHTVPVLDDDGFIVIDSHAIMTYMVGKYGKNNSMYPSDLKMRAMIDHMMFFDASIMSPRIAAVVKFMLNGSSKSIPEDLMEPVMEAYDIMERFMQNNPWVAGDSMSVADLSMLATMSSGNLFVPMEPQKYPKTMAWMKKMEELPMYAENQKGLDMMKGMMKKMMC